MIERLKSVLLIGLIVLAFFQLSLNLTMETGTGSGLSGLFFGTFLGNDDALEPDSNAFEHAAFPTKISLTASTGELVLAQGAEQYETYYRATIGLFDEALASTSAQKSVSRAEFLKAVSTSSLMYHYDVDLPMSLLSAWSGANEIDYPGIEVGCAALCLEQGNVLLYISDSDGTAHYAFQTAAGSATMSELFLDVRPNGTQAQHTAFEAVQGDEPIIFNAASLPTFTAGLPEFATSGELSRNVTAEFSFNSYLTRVYEDSAGARVYVEGHNTLSASPEGVLSFTAPEAGGIDIDIDLSHSYAQRMSVVCEAVRSVVFDVWGQTSGTGQLSLNTIEYDEQNDSWQLTFALHIGGIFVDRADGIPWAYAVVSDGKISDVTVLSTVLTPSEHSEYFPYDLAAASLNIEHEVRLRPRYLAENELYSPVMCTVEAE